MDPKHITRVKSSLAAWMNNKRRLEPQEEPGLISGESKDTRKRKRKEEMKEKVVGEWGAVFLLVRIPKRNICTSGVSQTKELCTRCVPPPKKVCTGWVSACVRMPCPTFAPVRS